MTRPLYVSAQHTAATVKITSLSMCCSNLLIMRICVFFVYYNECALKKKKQNNLKWKPQRGNLALCLMCFVFNLYSLSILSCLFANFFFSFHSIHCKMKIKMKIIRCTACNDIFCLANDCWLSQSSYHFQHLLHFTEFYKINLLFLYTLMRFLFGMCIKFKMYLKKPDHKIHGKQHQ